MRYRSIIACTAAVLTFIAGIKLLSSESANNPSAAARISFADSTEEPNETKKASEKTEKAAEAVTENTSETAEKKSKEDRKDSEFPLKSEVDYNIDDEYWSGLFTLTNVSDEAVYDVNIDFDAYDCFKGGLEDLVIIRYPSGLGVYVYIKDGKPDYDNREEYLPVLWVDTEENNVNQRKLEPGESVEVYFKTAISEAENKNSDERAAEDANPEPNPKTGNRFPWF